jgi:hypothetical protein
MTIKDIEKEKTMTFMAWPDIEAFNHVRKYLRIDPQEWWMAKEKMSGTSVVHYKSKVKLHGTNSAVQIHNDGTIVCQSRERVIVPEDDNAGFARWINSQKTEWSLAFHNIIFYGEWCGSGIQKSVAISDIGKKVFAVFAARYLDGSDNLIIEPSELKELFENTNIKDVYVLPWYSMPKQQAVAELDIDWKSSDEELTKQTTMINDWVLAVEECDPWVEAIFGVKGTGEGLVFYPTSTPHLGWENYSYLTFKAKGEKHKNIKTAAPAQVNAEAAASIDAFVDLVLTEARLQQGVEKVGGTDMKLTGKFVAWCWSDIQKETTDELEASKLDWKAVQKPISDKARTWYLSKAKK